MSFLYSGSLWSSLYCGISSLYVGLYRWLVTVSWLGKLVSMFWWMELYFFSLRVSRSLRHRPRSTVGSSVSFQMSQLFASGGQSIGISASVSVIPVNIQDWFPRGWTGWIPLQSKGLSRVFSNTTVQKHQFFGAQLSLWSNSHIYTWLLEKA